LQGAGLGVCYKSDGLNAFEGQVGQLPFNVGSQVLPRAASAEAIVKLGQKCVQFLVNTSDLFDVHIDSAYNFYPYKELSTSLPLFLQPYLRYSIRATVHSYIHKAW